MTRAEQREQSRDRIIDAAVDAFADLGFRGASTRQIASRAGVTQGLIAYHFRSKEQLWKAAADRIFAELRTAMVASVRSADDDPRHGARQLIRDYVRFAAAHPELVRFMVEEGKHDDDRMRWLVDTHLRPMYSAFALPAPTSTPMGDFDAAHLYYILAGAGSLIFALAPECRALTGVDPMSATRIEAHADLVAQLLVPE